jgi:VWFA-related protein
LFVFLLSSFALNSFPPQETIQQPRLQHEVSVTLKLIQVFVTDKQGRPLRSLEKADFEIYDSGQLKTITEFEKHFAATAVNTPRQDQPIDPRKTVASPTPSVQGLSRKFFFIFDVEKSDIQGLAQSKKTAVHFLKTQAQPTDEVAVLSYQARRGLIVHEYLNTDYAKIIKSIEKLKGIPGPGGGVLPTEPNEGEDPLGHLSLSLGNPADDELDMLRRNFVAHMSEFARALRSTPGYKNIVLFSAGFAQLTLAADSGLEHAYERMSKEFSASSSPVYAVNNLGMRANALLLKDRGNGALQDLSDLSGGRYFEDVAKADKIVTGLQDATGNYYVLGYSVDERWDGQFHEIEVRVTREGCVVSAQKGYFNPKPFAQLSDFEKELHRIELAFHENPQSQSPIELPLITLPCQDDSGTYLIVMVELPWEELKEVTQPPMEVVSLIVDQNNSVIESKGGYVQIPDIVKQRVLYYTVVPLAPGAYNCVMTLRNMKTGQGARARGPAIVPRPPASGLDLSPLLLLIPTVDKDTAYFRLAKRGKEAAAEAAGTLEKFFPFLSNRLVPVMDEIPRGTSQMLGIVRSMASNLPEANVELSASLKSDLAGKEVPFSPSILKSERRGNIDILLLELPIPEVDPGDYSIILVAKDKKSGARTEIIRRIRLI